MNCNRIYQKSILDTYTNTSTTLVAGANIPLNINYILNGCSIAHTETSPTINLLKAGKYLVTFNATLAPSGTATGNMTVQLFRNGVAVPGATSSVSGTSETDVENVNITKIIEVDSVCPCAGNGNVTIPLVFTNTGIEAVYSNIQVTVTKLV